MGGISCVKLYKDAQRQAALERQDLTCTYPAHHELESSSIITVVTIIILIIIIINTIHHYRWLHAGVLELIEFIRKENIKTLVEHIVDQHIERYTAVALSLPHQDLLLTSLPDKLAPRWQPLLTHSRVKGL